VQLGTITNVAHTNVVSVTNAVGHFSGGGMFELPPTRLRLAPGRTARVAIGLSKKGAGALKGKRRKGTLTLTIQASDESGERQTVNLTFAFNLKTGKLRRKGAGK
jgi:hypothetical protein